MKPELIMQADILDIIFENRNKEYGAYNLRKQYNNRVYKAVLVVFGLVSLLFLLNRIAFPSATNHGKLITALPPDIILKPVEFKETKIPKSSPQPAVKAATRQHNTPVIIKEQVVDPIATITELARNVLIGTETIDGPLSQAIQVAGEDQNGTKKKVEVIELPKEENKILIKAEFMPEFPGGQSALIRFLSKHLRMPENVLQPGERAKILVQFIVGKQGEVSNIVFLETSGEIFEQEVLRVMRKMPTWKAGRQNGENVQVYFKIPVVFDAPPE